MLQVCTLTALLLLSSQNSAKRTPVHLLRPGPKWLKANRLLIRPGGPAGLRLRSTKRHGTCWTALGLKAALIQAATVREALAKGIVPTGEACLCQSCSQIEDFQRLATLHKLEDEAFALLLAQGEGEKSDGKRANYSPTWGNARTSSGLSSCSHLSKPFLICQSRHSMQPMSQRTQVHWPHFVSLSPKPC